MTLEKYISSRLFADPFGITEAISSKKNSTQDTYDWGGIGWDWDIMDFKTVLEQAGYTEVEYTGELYSMFSGKHKEYAVREKTMYGADDIFISNENDRKIYMLGFSPKTIKLTTIVPLISITIVFYF